MCKVSVVMSVYNGLPHLKAAVESVLNQTYSDFEFIIIDDGSTDGSSKVLRRYAERDARIRLFTQENIGLTPSLNRGLSKAEGDYIARLDADDVCFPERFALQVQHLDEHPQCAAVGGQVLLIDGQGERIRNSRRPPISDGEGQMKGVWFDHASIDRALLDGEWPMLHSATMLRRTAVEAVGGYDERFETNEDHDLFLRLAEVGQLANLAETVVKYRRHRNQVTAWGAGRDFSANLRVKTMRRKAFQRRAMPLPRELRWPALMGTVLRRALSKTPVWSYLQHAWSTLLQYTGRTYSA